ncbi:MAG: hypothetical protein ABW007_13255 [Chitinophagaceae bacterium]
MTVQEYDPPIVSCQVTPPTTTTMPNRCILLLWGILCCVRLCAQQDTTAPALPGSERFITGIQQKTSRLEEKLDKQTDRILAVFLKKEQQLQRKLARKDSAAAAAWLANSTAAYGSIKDQLTSAGSLQQYIPTLDSLQSSLKFLESTPSFLNATDKTPEELRKALGAVKALETGFRRSEQVKTFLRERKQYLKAKLADAGFAKELKSLNKHAYYYSAQVSEYKELLKDHKKAEKKALEWLSKTQLFKDFMRKNSVLASLFRLPGDPNDPQQQISLAGLQTRSQVNNLVQQQISAGGPNGQAQFSQNMQQAQSQLNAIKDKLMKPGGGHSAELDMPDGFKPNKQKTKTFLQRIEYGATFQSQRSSSCFPATSDIAFTAGYKLNDNSIAGIGAGYKLGWGKNINHIRITHEGISLRSFIDLRLKGSFWLTGGYEMNYRSRFHDIAELKDRSGWQESGLIGLSKVVDMRSKLLKKTKVQLLWDFLSYGKRPKPAAVLFRIGYTF